MAPGAVMDGGHLEAPPHVELGDGSDSKENKLATLLKILKRYDGKGSPRPAEVGVSKRRLIQFRFVGVKDISRVRLSLPAQLLEPVSNLEYVSSEMAGVN